MQVGGGIPLKRALRPSQDALCYGKQRRAPVHSGHHTLIPDTHPHASHDAPQPPLCGVHIVRILRKGNRLSAAHGHAIVYAFSCDNSYLALHFTYTKKRFGLVPNLSLA